MSEEWAGKLKKVDDNHWLIPKDYKKGMRVDGIIYASDRMIKSIMQDQAPEQVANVAFLPGIVGRSIAMPDIHWGYGFPIGGVAAMEMDGGVISPGGVGYDINCGVRMLRTNLTEKKVRPRLKELVDHIFRDVPAGMRGEGEIKISRDEFQKVLTKGAHWMIENGYGWNEDIERSEQGGRFKMAEPKAVTDKAIKRGLPQLGTLGSGNHFLEIQAVDEIFDPVIAEAFGITEIGQITIMIHTGSRGFGHQTCTDYLDQMQAVLQKYNIQIPDRQLACAPIKSPEGQAYLQAMACAANFAWANRQAIAHLIRSAFAKVFKTKAEKMEMHQVYDIAHNIATIEEHLVDGELKTLCVHRKGATRAYGPGHKDVPAIYRNAGQPVLIPGDMGRYSYLLSGTAKAMEETFGSTCHGAGRLLSRHSAIKKGEGKDIAGLLAEKGIIVRAQNKKGLAEEASFAYKDVADVVDVCHKAGISHKVARMKPMGVIKG
jgi:tRNA-splicing ligase RtcB